MNKPFTKYTNHSNRGKGFEALIEWYHLHYENKGWGKVQKISTPAVMYKDKRGQTKYFRQESTIDYLGFLSGKAICIEAKECKGTYWSMNNLKPHQEDALIAFSAGSNKLPFILLNWLKYNRIWMFDICAYLEFKNNHPRKSINYEKDFNPNYFTNIGQYPDYINYV